MIPRLLRKLHDLVSDVWAAITAPYWNPYGGQAREAVLPPACLCCGCDLPPASERAVCEACRVLAREGVIRIPGQRFDKEWERKAEAEALELLTKGPRRKAVVKGPWS